MPPERQVTVSVLYDRPERGADADERERIEVAEAVRAALRRLGYRPVTVVLGNDPRRSLERLRVLRPACAVNLVEGWRGDPSYEPLGALLCRAAAIPHSGSPTHALALAGDKLATKRHLRRRGLPTPAWITDPHAWRDADAPYLLKSAFAHGSHGLGPRSLLRHPDEARRRLRALRARGGAAWFLERYAEGREFHVALLADPARPGTPRVLPVAETLFVDWPKDEPRIVGYRAKWRPGSAAYRRTPRRFLDRPDDVPLRRSLAHLGRRVWTAFGLEGYARIDVREGRDGALEIIDVNANPSLHPEAGFAAAAARSGLDYTRLVAALLPSPVEP
jgi:D-alanine-D-alanine ligase